MYSPPDSLASPSSDPAFRHSTLEEFPLPPSPSPTAQSSTSSAGPGGDWIDEEEREERRRRRELARILKEKRDAAAQQAYEGGSYFQMYGPVRSLPQVSEEGIPQTSGKFVQFPAPILSRPQSTLLPYASEAQEVLLPASPTLSSSSSLVSPSLRSPRSAKTSLPRSRARSRLSLPPALPPALPPPDYPPPPEPEALSVPTFPFLAHDPRASSSDVDAQSLMTPTRSSWAHSASSLEEAEILQASKHVRGQEPPSSIEPGRPVSTLSFAPARVVDPTPSPKAVLRPLSTATKHSSIGLSNYPFLQDVPSRSFYPFASNLAVGSSSPPVETSPLPPLKLNRRASSSPSIASSRSGKAKRWVLSQLPPTLGHRSSHSSSRASVSTFSSTPGFKRTPSRILKREAEMSLAKLIRRAQNVRSVLEQGQDFPTPREYAILRDPAGEGAKSGSGSGLRSYVSYGQGGTSSRRTSSDEDEKAAGEEPTPEVPSKEEVVGLAGGGQAEREVDVVVIGFGQDRPKHVRPPAFSFFEERDAEVSPFDLKTRGVHFSDEKALPPLPSNRFSRVSSLQVSVRRVASRPGRTTLVLVIALILGIILVGVLAG